MDRLSFASIAVGAALLIGAPVAWQVSQSTGDVGELPATTTSTPASDASSDVVLAPPSADELAREPAGDSADTSDAPASDQAEVAPTPAPAPPRQLRLPSLGVDAPVVDVGLEDSGGMEIPEDISTVGWYEPGVSPGATSGTAVISGHVDSREQGRGALWDLRTMDVDDAIEVEHADGSMSEWRVVARRTYPKEELPIRDIFTRFGEPRLALITCDGEFDRQARRYADNVVIYAVPVDA